MQYVFVQRAFNFDRQVCGLIVGELVFVCIGLFEFYYFFLLRVE